MYASYPYSDIADLKSVFDVTPNQRLARMLRWSEVRSIARTENIDLTPHRYQVDRIQALRVGLFGRVCNCHMPSGLRWTKVDNGEPVTVSIGINTIPNNLPFNALQAIQTALNIYWPVHTKLRFLLTTGGVVGNINISFGEIDGLNGTLGMAFMPTTGYEMDVADWSGDILIDLAERWNWGFFITVLGHELGHAIGIPHLISGRALMNPAYAGVVGNLLTPDRQAGTQRYGGYGKPILAYG